MKFYLVKPGDTLMTIASLYDTAGEEILKINGMDNPDSICPNQIIKIPKSAKSCPFPQCFRSPNGANTYTVQGGDTLFKIAQRFGTTVETLAVLNNIANPNVIRPGQVLILPRAGTTSYRVQPGDTLYSIAQRFNTTVSTLVSLNNIANPNLIYPGTVILVPAAPPGPEPGPEPPFLESLWFYVDSPAAWNNLQRHHQSVSALVPFWYQITPTGEIIDGTKQEVLDFAKRNNLFVYGLIHNFTGVRFDTELIDTVLADPILRERLVDNIVNLVKEKELNGVNIDFEFISPENRGNLTQFMSSLYQRLNPEGYVVTIDVLAKESDNPTNWLNGVYDYRALGEVSDQVIVLTQDEHYMSIPDPGPIASLPWVKRVLDYAVSQIPAEKVKMAAPVYGYDWPIGEPGRLVTYPEVVSLAQRYQAEIQFDTESSSPYLNYTANGIDHQVWFENAESFGIKLETAAQYGLGGFASWKLGDEDPAVWGVVELYQ